MGHFNTNSKPRPTLPSAQARDRRLSQHLGDIIAFGTSWVERKVVFPADWRNELDSIKSMTFTDLRTCTHSRSRIHDTVSRLKLLSTTLDALMEAVKAESQALESASRSCGLASLPDEILNMIFGLVVNEDTISRSAVYHSCEWRAAVRLSHVNKHFRVIMLSCPQHWIRIYSSSKMAASCLPRTNGLPLSVSLETFDVGDGWSFEPLISEVLPFLHRWKSVNIVLDPFSSQIPKERLVKEHELHLFDDATSLSHMEIRTDPWFSDIEWSPRDWSHWITPNLQSLTAEYYFPHSLPGLANLTQLQLSLRINDSSIANILIEVSKMVHLQDLTLSLETASEMDDTMVLYVKREFPRVRRLKIELKQNLPNDQFSSALVRSLFSSLYFPTADELIVELSGNDALFVINDGEWEERWMNNCYFNKDIYRLFRHFEQFPKVSSFRLKVVSAFGNYHDDKGWTELCIPLDMLPNVKHFTLESNTRLDIVEPENPDEITFENEWRVPPRVVGEKVPVLETVTSDMLDPSVAAEWLEEYLGKLKDAGKFTGFRELVVMEETDYLSQHEASYPGVEALEWCGIV
ncbi:hypothetical protein SCHPADRAFT_995932 [Schizopora paradoxa]|uniref:F-box domain-containing protein n=1 Tax=Schizopora paradoxa TaxID=27342 RepID=A0A0H2S0L5_9AGAM|nr:hypothetical protein SCHPADRAFT_995932 [Schizopora paradoxa]